MFDQYPLGIHCLLANKMMMVVKKATLSNYLAIQVGPSMMANDQ